MERTRFNYSMKNIPIPPRNSYLKKLIEKTESLIKRMRWKAFFFGRNNEKDKDNNDDNETNNYGFNYWIALLINKKNLLFVLSNWWLVRSIPQNCGIALECLPATSLKINDRHTLGSQQNLKNDNLTLLLCSQTAKEVTRLYFACAAIDTSVLYDGRGFSFERNCVLRRWESETLK